MKQILEKWDGKFIVDDDICTNLDTLDVKDGDDFHVRLLPKRMEIDDDILPAR